MSRNLESAGSSIASFQGNSYGKDLNRKITDQNTLRMSSIPDTSHELIVNDVIKLVTESKSTERSVKKSILPDNKEEKFREINRELLKGITVDDDDYFAIPSKPCSFYVEDRKLSASCDIDEHVRLVTNGESSSEIKTLHHVETLSIFDDIIAAEGYFLKCGIGVEIADENGKARDVEFYKYEDGQEKQKREEFLLCSKTVGLQRREELKELLRECSVIAKEINDLELNK